MYIQKTMFMNSLQTCTTKLCKMVFNHVGLVHGSVLQVHAFLWPCPLGCSPCAGLSVQVHLSLTHTHQLCVVVNLEQSKTQKFTYHGHTTTGYASTVCTLTGE